MRCLLGFVALAVAVALPMQARADFTEGFDDITTLAGSGWNIQNLSSPIGTLSWFQGNTAVFSAHAPVATNSYIGANFNSGAGTATLSNWLITPQTTINNGDTFSFYTRTSEGSAFPDRLQLRMSINGASTDVGASATSFGDFSTLLIDINPTYLPGPANYPETWTQFQATVSGLGGPASGRFAFRYFVENGGPTGVNSNYIGVDSVQFTQAIPEPSSALMLAAAGFATCLIRRRKV